MTTGGGSSDGGGGGGGANGAICCSKYSAVILSSELDATLAAAMPSVLALVRMTLLSRPSFFEMS